MRLPANVLAFAQDNIDTYKRFTDFVNHYRSITESTKKPYDETISFEEKAQRVHEDMIAEIETKSGVSIKGMEPHLAMTHPTVRWATFAVINARIDAVLPDALIDTIGLYTEIKVGGFGDNFAFEAKPRDLFAVTVAGRGKRRSELKKQFNGQVTITPVEHDISVTVSLYRVLAGQENLAEFVMKAAKSIETQMTYDAYDAFNTAMAALDNAGDDALRISGFSQATAVSLAQKISAWNGGRKPMFIGTQVALSSILPTNDNFRYDIQSDYVKVGYIRTFQGFDTMVLPQVADWTTPFKLKLDDTHIYVMSPSSKPLKMCIEGSLLTVQDDVYANSNLTQATTLKKSWGTGIVTSDVLGLIEISG
jgi:hypothetical protein